MYLLYSILLVFWGILLLPLFLHKTLKRNKSLPGLRQRFGRLPESLRHDGRHTIWFHSCSVGETLSLQPLAQDIHRRFPDSRFVFSTITKTGQDIAVERFKKYGPGNTFYFPIDLAFIVRRVLDWIQPSMIVIIDTEIWPNAVHQARRRGIPVLLANGRISAQSFRYYRLARPVLRRVFRDYRTLMMQSQEDGARIAQLGASADKISITGNIKIDRNLIHEGSDESLARSLEDSFILDYRAGSLIVAGSTHAGEEQTLLEVFRRIRNEPGLEKTRLLLAPRQPERFDAVAQLAERNGFAVGRRTLPSTSREAAVLILDTVGELATVYRFAAIAFVGGSLVRHGGHSILEPAMYAKAIVTGPSMENFRQIVEEFRAHGGIRQIVAEEENRSQQIQQLLDVFLQLLQNAKERNELGKTALSLLEKNRGATERTSRVMAAVFEELRGK